MLVARRDPPFHAARRCRVRGFASLSGRAACHRFIRFTTVMQLLGSLVGGPGRAGQRLFALPRHFFSRGILPKPACRHRRHARQKRRRHHAAHAGSPRRRDVRAKLRQGRSRRHHGIQGVAGNGKDRAPSRRQKRRSAWPPRPFPRRKTEKRCRRSRFAKPSRVRSPPPSSRLAVVAEPVRRDPAASDAQWVDAVRQALLTHRAEPAQIDRTKAPAVPASTLRPAPQELALPPSLPTSVAAPIGVVPTPAPLAAPAVPAATMPAPVPVQADAEHPVPPAAIPDAADAVKPDEQGHSRVRRWIAKVPLLGNVVENGLQ